MRIFLGIIILLAVLFIVARVLITRQVALTKLGVTNGQLLACPDSPNCVSSQAPENDAEHFMPAIAYTGDLSFMMSQILKVLAVTPRAKFINQESNYLHLEFRSQAFGFVDDVEFLLDDTAKLIHFRSASRMGKSDLGVNRKRMAELSEKLKTTP
jgi:uncharacterized protein (DUF1499 family)